MTCPWDAATRCSSEIAALADQHLLGASAIESVAMRRAKQRSSSVFACRRCYVELLDGAMKLVSRCAAADVTPDELHTGTLCQNHQEAPCCEPKSVGARTTVTSTDRRRDALAGLLTNMNGSLNLRYLRPAQLSGAPRS